jgi:DNA ligase (NAD+)
MGASRDDLQAVQGIGPATAEAVADFFEAERNREAIAALREHVEPRDVEAVEEGGPLEDLTFVFTGSLERFTRDEAQDLVERHCGNATGSVSGATDYLVVGEGPGSRKLEDAEDNDVPVLAEDEFVEFLQERGVEQ